MFSIFLIASTALLFIKLGLLGVCFCIFITSSDKSTAVTFMLDCAKKLESLPLPHPNSNIWVSGCFTIPSGNQEGTIWLSKQYLAKWEGWFVTFSLL